MNLRSLVDDTQSRSGRIFDWFIQFAIVVSILGITFETVPDLHPRTYRLLNWIEYACVAIFTVELLLRVLFSKQGFRYLFTFFGIIDLLAILPFYLALGVDLRGLRAFRLLRIFRVLKLARYNNALRRYRNAFRKAREELILFGVTAMIVIYLSSVGIYYFESAAQPDKFGSIPESFWWAVATLTTVGYGDVYPITTGGKIFTFFILSVGLAIVAVPSGIIASTLTEAREEQQPPQAPPS